MTDKIRSILRKILPGKVTSQTSAEHLYMFGTQARIYVNLHNSLSMRQFNQNAVRRLEIGPGFEAFTWL